MAHWHGLAKLRLHTDYTLNHLEGVTSILGAQLRRFQTKTCAAFDTVELKREVDARKRRQARVSSGANISAPTTVPQKSKTFNLNTYKNHALGDYANTIRKYGTSDLYSTELVGQIYLICCFTLISQIGYRVNWNTGRQKQDIKERAANYLYSK